MNIHELIERLRCGTNFNGDNITFEAADTIEYLQARSESFEGSFNAAIKAIGRLDARVIELEEAEALHWSARRNLVEKNILLTNELDQLRLLVYEPEPPE